MDTPGNLGGKKPGGRRGFNLLQHWTKSSDRNALQGPHNRSVQDTTHQHSDVLDITTRENLENRERSSRTEFSTAFTGKFTSLTKNVKDNIAKRPGSKDVSELEGRYEDLLTERNQEIERRRSFDDTLGPVAQGENNVDVPEMPSSFREFYRGEEVTQRQKDDAVFEQLRTTSGRAWERLSQQITNADDDDTKRALEKQRQDVFSRIRRAEDKWSEIVDKRYLFDTGEYGPANPADSYANRNITRDKAEPPGHEHVQAIWWQGYEGPSNVTQWQKF